ncbi:MAG: hypothetical protein HKP53_09230 [Eudoraea sp.]|nr:hypothetical protein [Eudoraea sp.]
MKLIPKLFGMLMILAGIVLLINSGIIIGFIEKNMENTPLYIFAIVVRIVLGILFIAAAGRSRYPGVIKILGYFFVIAAFILIFMKQDGFQHFTASLIPSVKPWAPLAGLLAIAFGGFLVYAFSRNKQMI